jgi:hypothetical protein
VLLRQCTDQFPVLINLPDLSFELIKPQYRHSEIYQKTVAEKVKQMCRTIVKPP